MWSVCEGNREGMRKEGNGGTEGEGHEVEEWV